MTKKKIKQINSDNLKLEKPKIINKSKWLNGTFKTIVEIVKMTNEHMMKIEMIDSKGNIIVWYGRNYDTNKIKLNNKLEIVGKAKQHIEENNIKKTLIKYLTY